MTDIHGKMTRNCWSCCFFVGGGRFAGQLFSRAEAMMKGSFFRGEWWHRTNDK